MKLDEKWIRAHLPKEFENESLDFFAGEYLDGLNVMSEGERGGPDTVIYRAKDEEDLRWWQLEQICSFISDSREHDDHDNPIEESRPGSIINIID